MTVKMSLGTSAKDTSEWLIGRGSMFVEALTNKLTFLMLKLQQHIVKDKLSGQVLSRRSGKLANSIVAYPATVEGEQLIGRVQGASGPAFYGRYHEFGGKGYYDIYPKNKLALAFFPMGASNVPGGKQILRGMSQMSNLKRRASSITKFAGAGGVVVKHVHHPPLPQRSFMASSAADMREQIINELNLVLRKPEASI